MPVYSGKLDTRFADEEDAPDLLHLVNKAYAVETEGPYAFRTGDRIGDNELSESLSSSNSRWLVCETPAPEEHLLACLHFRLESAGGGDVGGGSVASLTCLAVDPDMQRKGVGQVLLRRAETIMRNLGCRYTRTEAAAVREDVESFLAACGYKEVGGGLSPELSRPVLLPGQGVPPRFVTYQKDLSAGPGVGKEGSSSSGEAVGVMDESPLLMSSMVEVLESLGFDAHMDEEEGVGGEAEEAGDALSEGEDGKGGGGGDDVPLEDIIGELFKALRTDEGRAEFERLVREQEEEQQDEPTASP